MKQSKFLLLATSLSLGLTYHAQAASATWSGGTSAAVWNNSANWGGTAFPGTSGTTDVATFSSGASITSGNLGLGQNISIGSIVLNTGGNVTVTDNSNTLTLNGSTAINVGAGQNLTLNNNTTLAAATTVSSSAGSILTFGSGTLTLGNFAQTFNGGGTIDINNAVVGGSTGSTTKLTFSGVTVNFAGTSVTGKFNSTPVVVTSGAVLNLQTDIGEKITLGTTSGGNNKGTVLITQSGLTIGDVVAVAGAGAGGNADNTFTIGANISGGGTATYKGGSLSINNTGTANAATTILTANAGTTLNLDTPIGSAAGTTGTLLQISGGGTVVFGATTGPNAYTTSTAANGTEVMNNTNLQLDVTAATTTALSGNTTVDAGSSVQLLNTNQMPSNTLTINGSGGSTGGGTVAATGALENVSGNNTFAAAVTTGTTGATISSDANTLNLTGAITTSTNGKTLTFGGAGNIAVNTTGISGAGGVAKTGSGSLALSTANTYNGPTTLSGGSTYVTNTTGSAFGANTVAVSGSTTVLGGNGKISGAVTLSSGATLYSGGVASGTPTTGPGTGLNLSSSLAVNGASLTFALTNTASSSYASPATSTTYLNLGTTGTISFSGSDTVNLVDLTTGNLSLRMNQPYLLVSANSSTMFSGLVVENAAGQIGLSDNGFQGTVLGVWAGGSNPLSDYSAITIDEFAADGSVLDPTSTSSIGYYDPSLVLVGGDLEVVPEPGTWALMLGGLALLVVVQRRRSQS